MYIVTMYGTGDQIMVSGAVAYLSQFYDNPVLCCWRENIVNIRSFYVNHPNIEFFEFNNKYDLAKLHGEMIRCGPFGCDFNPIGNESMDQCIYRQLGLPFRYRWEYCPIEKAAQSVRQLKAPSDLPIAHHRGEDLMRDNLLPNEFMLVTDNGNSILEYADALINAPEIHCIDSSVFHLVNSLPVTGKLFFHRYARKTPRTGWFDYKRKMNWTIFED